MADELSRKLRTLKLQKASSRFRLPTPESENTLRESSSLNSSYLLTPNRGLSDTQRSIHQSINRKQDIDHHRSSGFHDKNSDILTEFENNNTNNVQSRASTSIAHGQFHRHNSHHNVSHVLEFKACEKCGRKFNLDSLKKHEKVCEKVFMSKRKKFSSQGQRRIVEGAFASSSSYLLNSKSSRTSSLKGKRNITTPGNSLKRIHNRDDVVVGKAHLKSKGSNWRKQSAQFRAALAAMRGGESGTSSKRSSYSTSNLSAAEMYANEDDRIQCPYCERRFSHTAAEKHFPFCKTQHQRRKILNKSKVTSKSRR